MISDTPVLFLATHLVQVTLVAIVAWAAFQLGGKKHAHFSHALWVLVLLKCVSPPLLASPTGVFSWVNFDSVLVDNHSDDSMFAVATDLRGPSRETVLQSSVTDPVGAPDLGRSWRSITTDLVVMTWLVVSASIGVYLIARLQIFLGTIRRLEQQKVGSEDPLQSRAASAVRRLTKLLGIRRSVGVLVLDHPIGPAVVGLFRPKILIPRIVARDASREELESLIGHELVHLRRGDLWWSLLQSTAVSLTWCHPLTWWISRRLSQATEMCCDEETMASLGVAPATYARSLIAVLEKKHSLRAAPLLPGVRPVEITANRLEKIMCRQDGKRNGCPLWVKLTLAACAAVVLPGAGLTNADEGEKRYVLEQSEPVNQPEPDKQRGPDKQPARSEIPPTGKRQHDHDAASPKELVSYEIHLLRTSVSDFEEVTQDWEWTGTSVNPRVSNVLTPKQIEDLKAKGQVLSAPRVLSVSGTTSQVSTVPRVPDATRMQRPVEKDFSLQLTGTLDQERDEVQLTLHFEETLPEASSGTPETNAEETDSNAGTTGMGAAAGDDSSTKSPVVTGEGFISRLRIPAGETIALGMGPQTHRVRLEREVPVLSSVPVVGGMFKNSVVARVEEFRTILIKCNRAGLEHRKPTSND